MSEKPIQKFIHVAREVMKAEGYFVENLWHVDDVHFLCEQRGWPQLRHEEATAVFTVFSEIFDGECGLTWEKLEQATQIYLAQQGQLQQMLHNEETQAQRL